MVKERFSMVFQGREIDVSINIPVEGREDLTYRIQTFESRSGEYVAVVCTDKNSGDGRPEILKNRQGTYGSQFHFKNDCFAYLGINVNFDSDLDAVYISVTN